MDVKLKYIGDLNPVIKGVGIIKKNLVFKCDALIAADLLKRFPKEYTEDKRKERSKPKVEEVKNKMTEPKEFKAEAIK